MWRNLPWSPKPFCHMPIASGESVSEWSLSQVLPEDSVLLISGIDPGVSGESSFTIRV
jgi:hypothetical protein